MRVTPNRRRNFEVISVEAIAAENIYPILIKFAVC
jgi:hypothetical protein